LVFSRLLGVGRFRGVVERDSIVFKQQPLLAILLELVVVRAPWVARGVASCGFHRRLRQVEVNALDKEEAVAGGEGA
jgi:hypothetical protein